MTPMRTGALMLLLAGCASPLHLTYDYGRAYTESIVAQAETPRSRSPRTVARAASVAGAQ